MQVAVALGQAVFLWNASSGAVDEVAACQEGSDDHVTSVAWAADGKHLAVGTNSSVVQVRRRSRGAGPAAAGAAGCAVADRQQLRLSPHTRAQIWDVARHKQIRSLRGHSARVGALAWNHCTLSSGSRDSSIINHDVRCAAGPVSPTPALRTGGPQPTCCARQRLWCACPQPRR